MFSSNLELVLKIVSLLILAPCIVYLTWIIHKRLSIKNPMCAPFERKMTRKEWNEVDVFAEINAWLSVFISLIIILPVHATILKNYSFTAACCVPILTGLVIFPFVNWLRREELANIHKKYDCNHYAD